MMEKLYKLNGLFTRESIKVLAIAIYLDILEPEELEYMFEKNSTHASICNDLVDRIKAKQGDNNAKI